MVSIEKVSKDAYIFQVLAESGNTLLKSITYPSEREAQAAVAKLKALPSMDNLIERKTNAQGKFLFNLKDAEGSVVGQSLYYTSEAGMENGIKNLKARIHSN